MIRTYVRGSDLSLIGEVRGWTDLEITLRYNAVGSWSITGPDSGLLTQLSTSGCGLIAVDTRGVPLHSPNGVLISGDVEDDGPHSWDSSGDSGTGTGQYVGGDDLAVVANELAFPVPTQTVAVQTAAAYDVRSGVAETVIKAYIAANVGVGRHANRSDAAVPNAQLVTIAPDLARGSTVSYKARWDPLMEMTRSLCSASTPKLGVRVQQDGDDLAFDCYVPQDRSARAVFSRARRNLRGYSTARSAPTATHVVVAGAGEGDQRIHVERKDAAAAQEWRKIIRVYVDQRSTDVTSELEAAGDEALAAGRRSGVLSATAVDTPTCRFGQHFGLGDTVAIEIAPGVRYVDQVTAVKITVGDDGMRPAEITIGNPDIDPQQPEVYRRVAELERKLLDLQRRY